jgi:hypothetical protein
MSGQGVAKSEVPPVLESYGLTSPHEATSDRIIDCASFLLDELASHAPATPATVRAEKVLKNVLEKAFEFSGSKVRLGLAWSDLKFQLDHNMSNLKIDFQIEGKGDY